jgi:hypothetical protein
VPASHVFDAVHLVGCNNEHLVTYRQSGVK